MSPSRGNSENDGKPADDVPRDAGKVAAEELRPGTQLNGLYEIDARMASGGMGEIYRAHVIPTGDAVVIKVIRADLAENEAAISFFRKEASALHHLHHEAIVRYYVFSIDPSTQRAYLAMELVEGPTLSQVIRKGPMPIEAVGLLAARVARGLDAAHKQHIVHRDVSPDNIVLQKGDVREAKIIDFGIAHSTQLGSDTNLQVEFAGKYSYVSPEHVGLYGGEITEKSDIYSLGLVLLAALRGGAVDMGRTQAELVEKRKELPDLKNVDARLRPLLTRMLQPDPANRPDSMVEVIRFFSDMPASGKRQGRNGRDSTKPTTGWLVAGSVFGALVLVGSGIGAYVWLHPNLEALWRSSKVRPEPARQQTEPATTSEPIQPDRKKEDRQRIVPQTRREQIVQFIDHYDGGPCFFVMLVDATDTSATIEGFGATREPFDRLDSAFKTAHGFEALIGAKLVTPAQCSALDFVNRMKSDETLGPRLQFTTTELHAGQALRGSINNVGSRELAALLVDDNGSVRNVTNRIQPGDIRSFDIPIEKSKPGQQPQLLIAVTMARPITSLTPSTSLPADRFFPAVQAEATANREPLGVALRYIRVD